MKTILHLCADTGSDTMPYQKHSDYEVILVGSGIGVENYHPPKSGAGRIVVSEEELKQLFTDAAEYAYLLAIKENREAAVDHSVQSPFEK